MFVKLDAIMNYLTSLLLFSALNIYKTLNNNRDDKFFHTTNVISVLNRIEMFSEIQVQVVSASKKAICNLQKQLF